MSTSTAVALDITRRGEMGDELHKELSALVVGQDLAVSRIVEAYQVLHAGLHAPGKPLGSFLFLGPTGTGKTRMVEALAQVLHEDQSLVLKVDCAEFQHGHEIAKLIGSPPGYLGHRETSPALSQEAVNSVKSLGNPISLVLFDEIEKASDALWNLLLGILDKGTLTLGNNSKVDFTHSVIFMTSNVGARDISRLGTPGIGFTSPSGGAVDITRVGQEAVKKKFTPEFVNRIDHTVVFQPLSPESLRQVLDLELTAIYDRILTATVSGFLKTRFLVNVTAGAKSRLLELGNDPKYGARFLKRTLEKQIMHPLVNLLASDQVQDGDVVEILSSEGDLIFQRIPATV